MDYKFLNKIINKDRKDLPEFIVKFNDSADTLTVKAIGFVSAGILAMAYKLHSSGSGWGIEYVESKKTGNRVPVTID
jgi:hypothetical protein